MDGSHYLAAGEAAVGGISACAKEPVRTAMASLRGIEQRQMQANMTTCKASIGAGENDPHGPAVDGSRAPAT